MKVALLGPVEWMGRSKGVHQQQEQFMIGVSMRIIVEGTLAMVVSTAWSVPCCRAIGMV